MNHRHDPMSVLIEALAEALVLDYLCEQPAPCNDSGNERTERSPLSDGRQAA